MCIYTKAERGRTTERAPFKRDMPTRSKRKLHAIGGGRGMWSLPVRQASNHFQSAHDSVIISTDANPAPGLSRVGKLHGLLGHVLTSRALQIATRSSQSDITITTRIPGTTLGAAPFFQGTAILHVMFNVSNVIRVLEPGTYQAVGRDMQTHLALRWDGKTSDQGPRRQHTSTQNQVVQHQRPVYSYHPRRRYDRSLHRGDRER